MWTSHGEQLRADLERNIGTMSRSRSEFRRSSNQLNAWGQQMRAIGTTIRYAFAGAIVYSVAQAINSLTQFEAKMGDIAALATTFDPGTGAARVTNDISLLADNILLQSLRLGRPVEDIQQQVQTLYSSFDVPEGRRGLQMIDRMTETITKLGRVAEITSVADMQKLSEGVIGMAFSLGRGPQDIPRMADIIATITAESVGFRGGVLAGGLGRLASAAQIGNVTPEQLASLVITASRAGGSPMVIVRGISQLMRTIARPTTPRELGAYRALGLPTDPATLREMGGFNIVQAMIERVRAGGGLTISQAGRRLTEEQLADMGDITDPAQIGVRGPMAKVMFDLFGRAESLQQFVILLNQGNDVLNKFTSRAKSNKGVVEAMFGSAFEESQLIRAANAWRVFGIQFARNFDPVLQAVGAGIEAVSEFSITHKRLTMGVTLGTGGTLLGARLLRRLIPRGALGRLGRVGRLAGAASAIGDTAITGALAAEAAPAILSGMGQGSRAAPFWVIIHPTTWAMPGTPQGGFGGPGGNIPPVVATSGGGRMARWMRRLSPAAAARFGAKVGGPAIAAGLAAEGVMRWTGLDDFQPGDDEAWWNEPPPRPGEIADWMRRRPIRQLGRRGVRGGDPRTAGIRQRELFAPEPRLRSQGAGGFVMGSFLEKIERALQGGESSIRIRLEPTDEARRLFRAQEVHVPVKHWGAEGGRIPSSRRQPRSGR